MVQLIQSNQLSQIPGSAGQQQVIQDQSPTLGDAISNTIGRAQQVYDTAGDIYAQNKSRSIAKEELENIDKAVSIAEKSAREDEFVAPEELPVSDAEFKVIEGAVRSGAMSREKARLLASSRLRTRISEEPFFANKLRQAASQVVGFNIESEQARQYFASFQTEAQLAQGGKNKYLSDINDRAVAYSQYLGTDFEETRAQLLKADRIEQQKDMLENMKEMGQISANEWANERTKMDNAQAFEFVLTELKTLQNEGESVDNVVVNSTLETRKQMHLTELRNGYEGDINSAEFKSIVDSVNARYEGYKGLIEDIGVDKLNKVRIDRAAQLRTLRGDEMFADIKLIREAAGEGGVQAYFETMSGNLNATQRDQLFRNFPLLKRIDSLVNSTDEELQKRLATTTTKVLTDGDLNDDDREVIDPVVKNIYDQGEEETQTKLIEKLQKDGMKYKGLSLVVNKNPRDASVDNVKYGKMMYEEELPSLTAKVGSLFAQSEDLDLVKKDNGEFLAVIRSSTRQGPGARQLRDIDMERHAQAQELVEKINVYKRAIDKGWGNTFGTTMENFSMDVAKQVEDNKRDYSVLEQNQAFQQNQQNFIDNAVKGNLSRSREAYNKLQAQNPDAITSTFDELYDEIRRRRAEGEK